MNVLSLFDGMSCWQVALERAGVVVDNYYSSEIDTYAVQIGEFQQKIIEHFGR